MYSQNFTTNRNQLPPCVPMNPATRTRSAAKPTARELLQKRAALVSQTAAADAMAQAPYFKIKAYNPDTNVVTIRKDGEASTVHNIDLNTDACDCVNQKAIDKLNALLVAERICQVDCGKCRKIVSELGGDELAHLLTFPPAYFENAEFIPSDGYAIDTYAAEWNQN